MEATTTSPNAEPTPPSTELSPGLCSRCLTRPFTPGFHVCKPCLLKASLQRTLPFIDYRHKQMSLDYPPNRLFILHEFKRAHANANLEWSWISSFHPLGPSIRTLSPADQLANHRTQNPLGNPIFNGRLLFGFENMWNVREPMFVVQDDGEAKIYWQRPGRHWREAVAPEGTRFLREAISARLFYQRIAENFGAPPESWPLHDVFDTETEWGACLQRANGDQVYFRVNRGMPQVAFYGTVMGMYDALGLVQLIVGPPGRELYTEKFEGEGEGGPMLEKVDKALGHTEVLPRPLIQESNRLVESWRALTIMEENAEGRLQAVEAAIAAAEVDECAVSSTDGSLPAKPGEEQDRDDGKGDRTSTRAIHKRSDRALLGPNGSDTNSELSSAPDMTKSMREAFEGVAVTSSERPTTVDSGVGISKADEDKSGVRAQL